ncbi:MAG TPA: MBG domain-containing protein, partial [Nocardioides sp.]|nr:MBG domain-containing protein [Nocardioides sp.]
LQVTKATATVVADNKSKVYGSADPEYTFSVQGLVDGDSLTTPATCSVSGAHADVGTYPITCSGASAGGNYDIAYAGGTLTVTRATVVITAEPKSRAYGAPDPAFTFTVAGLVDGDTLATNPTCSVTGPHANAGTYPITCSGAAAGSNYTVTYVDSELTITPKTVVITADDATKVYGEDDPAFTYTVAGLVEGDDLLDEPSCGVEATHQGGGLGAGKVGGDDVGEYPIACGGADAGANYEVTYAVGTLVVTPRTLAITADDAAKSYGDPDPAFGYSVQGLVGIDQLVAPPTCEPRVAHQDVGTYPITCTDADAGDNYTIEYYTGQLVVVPATVVVSADNRSITYGDPEPTFTWTVDGIDEDDLVADPTCAVAGAHSDAGSYEITCSGADAGSNYDVAYQPGTLTVSPKVATVVPDSQVTVYGDDDPDFTWTTDGLVGDDDLATDPTCGVAGAHSAVGSYPITCTGADAGDNYTLQYGTSTLTVTAKAAVVVADDQQITFGEDDPIFTYQVSGLNGEDALKLPATCTVSSPHSDVGTYPITCWGAEVDGNYTLSYQAGSLVVVPAVVTVTADNQSKVYGTPDPAFTHQVTGLLGGDELATAPECGVVGPHAAAGEYDITCSGADAGANYDITYVDGTLTVTKATVTIAADAKVKVYGASDPAFTYGVTGLVGDAQLVTEPTCAAADPHTAVGSYAISCSGADAGPDYTIEYRTGTLTVTPAVLTVTAQDRTKVQGDPLPSFAATITGYVNGDDSGDIAGAPALSTSATATSPAGTYPINVSIGTLSAADYTFAFVAGTLTVTSQPPTATIVTPPTGAVYFQGQAVKASYSCTDPDGTVTSCAGPVPNGSGIDTATTGTKTFTVTATDNNGLTGTATTIYKVVPVAGVCRATGVSVLGVTLGDANPATTPCLTQTDRILRANVTLMPNLLLLPAQTVKAEAIQGVTEKVTGGSKASAEVSGATIVVAGATIKVTALSSSASSQLSSCTGAATTAGASKVAGLTINGVQVVPAAGLSTPLKVDVGLVGVALNEQTRSGSTLTQTAVRITVLGNEIVLGRSIAGATCGS